MEIGTRVTNGKKTGTVQVYYPSTQEVCIRWDGAKRLSYAKVANLRTL